MDSQPQRRYTVFSALQHTEFRYFAVQRFFYTMALRMVTATLGWKIKLLTGDPLALGLVGLCEVVPAVSLALYAGHKIDSGDKRNILLRCILGYLVCALGLVFAGLHTTEQWLGKNLLATVLYVIVFITGIIRAFAGPTSNAIVAQLIPREKLPMAITFNQSTFLSASILGHASAGFFIAYLGMPVTFVIIATYVLIAATFTTFIARKPAQHLNMEQRTWESVKDGLRYVYRTKELISAISLDLFAVLFGGAVALIPFFATDILKVGAIGFGWLNAASDIGAVISIVFMSFFPLRRNQGRILLFAVAGFGLCIITFGLSKLFWLSMAALILSGALDGISVVVRGTILQLKTPDELRGRVSSVSTMFISSSNELGQFESGVAAKLMGIVTSVVFGGCMTLGIVVATWFKAPSLRKMQY